MMGRVPSPSISCSSAKTHLHKAGMSRPLPELQIPGQDFTPNTSPRAVQGQTRLDRLDLGHEEHQVPLPWASCCWALCMAQPSWHTASTDPGIGKSQRTELPGQFAVWAVEVTDRPEEQEGERMNSPFMQTAGLLLQIPLVSGLCLGPSAAIAWGSQSKSWPRPDAQGICQAAAK